MFYIFGLFSIFINNRSLYQSFGFHAQQPIIIGFILFSDALAPMDTVVKLLMNILSRKFEYEAGMFVLLSSISLSRHLYLQFIRLLSSNTTLTFGPLFF